jgi:hypothetical protein
VQLTESEPSDLATISRAYPTWNVFRETGNLHRSSFYRRASYANEWVIARSSVGRSGLQHCELMHRHHKDERNVTSATGLTPAPSFRQLPSTFGPLSLGCK